jgi:glycosyltransferase involved in cell wall biosynthesis
MPRLTYLSGAPRVSTDPDAEAGGARVHVLGIIHGFESLGWVVQAYVAGDKLPRFVTGQGSEILLSTAAHRALMADLLRIAANTVNGWATRSLIADTDLVYERYGAFQCLGRTFQESGIPWILETQGIEFHNRYKTSRTTALEALQRRNEFRTYRSCDGIVCSTADVKREIVDWTGVRPENILILPNAVDSAIYNPARFTPERTFDEFTVGFVGRLYPWQGLDLLLHALQVVKESGEPALRAVIIGDGIERQRLEALADRLGIQPEVRFVGHVSDRRSVELLLGCEVSYVGHQRSVDGRLPFSPIKLYESLSLGVPVVAPRESAFTAVIREGETGFFFVPNDARSLLDSLLAAYNAKDRLMDMGRHARKDAVRDHGWTQRVETLLEWLAHERGLLRIELSPAGGKTWRGS